MSVDPRYKLIAGDPIVIIDLKRPERGVLFRLGGSDGLFARQLLMRLNSG